MNFFEMRANSHALVRLPANGQALVPAVDALSEWFEYPVLVYPHHTDYGGIVWHGTYLIWMEEARVEYFRQVGVQFADLVALGCDLPVVDLSIRYHRGLRMGESAVVKTRMTELTGVRLNWEYQILSAAGQLCVSAKVALVAVDREKGKILRKLPPAIATVLIKRPTSKPMGS